MKRKTRKFSDGGDTNNEFTRPIKSTADAKSETADAPKKTSFSAAFAAARRSGDKTFEWQGKKYGTAMKGEATAKPKTSGVIEAGIAAAKDQEDRRSQIKDVTTSPRLSDILNTRNMAAQADNSAREQREKLSKQEQARTANLLSTGTGRALLDKQEPRITQRMRALDDKAKAYNDEFKSRDSAARSAYEGQGYDYDAMKKGGKVKKYAKGGTVASASKRADGIAQKGKTRGKIY